MDMSAFQLSSYRTRRNPLVVNRVLGIAQVKDNTGVRLGSTTSRELLVKVNGAVEAETAVVVDVDVQGLEVSRGVDVADLPGLHKVIRDHNVLLVRCDLDVVRANRWLHFVRVIQTLDVIQVANVKSRDVVCSG